jgi:hypothetical protein
MRSFKTKGVFLGKVAHSRMRDSVRRQISMCDIHACAAVLTSNSPNKFFDGIAAGLPAVFNRSTCWNVCCAITIAVSRA